MEMAGLQVWEITMNSSFEKQRIVKGKMIELEKINTSVHYDIANYGWQRKNRSVSFEVHIMQKGI